MSPVPPSTFADRLRRLDRREFAAFVADLWAASGWETEIEGSVVVARRDGEQQRLLVEPSRRLARWRRAPVVEGAVDRIVTARRVDGREGHHRGTPDAPVVDADDLRRLLPYGVDADASKRICSDTLGVPLRDDRWSDDGRTRTASHRALAAVGLAAIAVVALVAVAGGVPGLFVGDGGVPGTEGDDPASDGETIVPDEGVDRITVGDVEDVAAGPTVEAGESATVELTTTPSGDVDELAYEVRTPDATANGSTTVVGPASFEIVDGEIVDVQEEHVGDGAAVTVILAFTPDAPGERAYAVTTADDRHEGTLEVDGASPVPGFGIGVTILGLVGAAVVLRDQHSSG